MDETPTDRRNVGFGITQRGGRCVDRVGAENEIVVMRHGGAEKEFSVISFPKAG